MANASILAAFERMWQHVVAALGNKADSDHTHDISDVGNLANELNGKANSSHGNHVPDTQTTNNAVFLRNDNTWATVTPANIGAASISHEHTLSDLGITATATELNYVDGVTSNIQTQLSTKASVTEIANLYVWKKYNTNPNQPKETARSNVQIAWRLGDYGDESFVVAYADSVSIDGGNISLVNSTIMSTISSTSEAQNLRGKYIYSQGDIWSNDSDEGYYFIPTNATFTIQGNGLYVSSANKLSVPACIGYATSKSSSTYTVGAAHNDGYWYQLTNQIGDVVSMDIATVSEVETYLGI